MKLQSLLDGIEVTKILGVSNPIIDGVVSDHRDVKPGYAFICYEGLNVDGHSFIADAIKNGATVIISEKEVSDFPTGVTSVITPNGRIAHSICAANWFGNPAKRLKLTGVTGTNGKTSTAHLIYGILKSYNVNAAVLGTVGHSYNVAASDSNTQQKTSVEIPALLTTPDAFQLNEMLKQIADAGVEHVVMETSSQGLAQHRLCGLTFETAVFTNLTQDHLDYHGTIENYLTAKLKLFEQISDEGIAVLNADSPATKRIVEHIPEKKIITYGLKKDSDITAHDIESTLKGLTFTALNTSNNSDNTFFNMTNQQINELNVSINLLGSYNIYNALAAICVGLRYNCSASAIQTGLTTTVVPGRFERVSSNFKSDIDFAVIVDYAHTPDGLENVLTAAREISDGKIISVFGCGGDRDRGKRPKMGAISTQIADMSVITSDNPRTENPDEIISDIVSNLPHDAAFKCIPERHVAIQNAIFQANPGDVVVIAGKGHENYQEIHGKRYPFDDREVASKILQELSLNSKQATGR